MSIPQIYLLLMGSVLPPEHPAWDDPEVTSKDFTADGAEKAVHLLKCSRSLKDISTAEQYQQLSRAEKVIHQLRCMQQDFALFKQSYSDMQFVEVAPKLNEETGEIICPTQKDYLNAWKTVVLASK